ncbi:MAG: hypothetical protein QXM68_03560 [Candidatus Aenigmatarchaeota archaeon]|nr:hypothetical protein [Candidatus Aenigmarchaeota archaeon]
MKGIARETVVMIAFLILAALLIALMFTILKDQISPVTDKIKELFKNMAKAI